MRILVAMLVLGLGVAGSARAADWPMIIGSEAGRKETAFQPFGFAQLLVESTPFAQPVEGLKSPALALKNGEMAAFNIEEPFELSLRRARLGARGSIPGTQGLASYFVAVEAGQGAATRDRGVVLLDASVSLHVIPGAHIRVGQFKLPTMDETLESNPVTADFINFSPIVTQLMLEQPVEDGQFAGPAYANRDIGVQLFDSFLFEVLSQNIELSYAAMVSQGRMGGLDIDDHKDFTGRAQLAWLPDLKKRWSPERDEVALFAWRLQGAREIEGDDVVRMRQGAGAHVRLFHTRTRLEVVHAEGALFAGQSPPFPGEPLSIIPEGSAWGWNFDVAVGGPGSALGPLELDFGLEELHRLDESDPRARVFRNALVGAQWHFSKHAKLLANWELRDIGTPSAATPPDATRIAASVADLYSLQLTVTF